MHVTRGSLMKFQKFPVKPFVEGQGVQPKKLTRQPRPHDYVISGRIFANNMPKQKRGTLQLLIMSTSGSSASDRLPRNSSVPHSATPVAYVIDLTLDSDEDEPVVSTHGSGSGTRPITARRNRRKGKAIPDYIQWALDNHPGLTPEQIIADYGSFKKAKTDIDMLKVYLERLSQPIQIEIGVSFKHLKHILIFR